MAILLAAEVSDKAMDYTMVTLIAMFLFIWMIFYLFNVLWKDDDDDQLLESQVSMLYYIIDYDIIDHDTIDHEFIDHNVTDHDIIDKDIIKDISLWQVEELQSNEEGETNRTSRFGWKKLFRSNKIVDEPIKSEEMERRQHAFEDL